MAESALSGVFRQYTLTYETETGTTTTDSRGNEVPATTNEELIINFEPSRSAQIVFQEGADPKIVRGTGTCINPSEMPSAVKVGSELDMTFAGIAGKLRILQIAPAPLAVLDEVLGQEFRAEWRAAT